MTNTDLTNLFLNALPDIAISDAQDKLDANTQWRGNQPNSDYLALLRPRDTLELRHIFEICAEHNIGIVPRAGGTALTNGSTIAPPQSHYERSKECVIVQPNFPEIFLIDKDKDDVYVTVSPGVTARDIEKHPDLAGLYKVPVDLGIGSKEGIAEIVGYLANNAAGTGAAFHGRAIDMVKTVQAIKPDGSDWVMQGDDPALAELIGMGGITGFITQATIKLQRIPQNQAVMALRLNNIKEMYDLLEACKEQCWPEMQLFERMNNILFQEVVTQLEREGHEFTTHLNRDNKEGDVIFIQLGSHDPDMNLEDKLQNLLTELPKDTSPLIRTSKEEQKLLLSYRVVNASLACENHVEQQGGKVVAFDISVPSGDDKPFPSLALTERLEDTFEGIQMFAFGHAAGVEKISPTTPRGGTALHFNPVLPANQMHREAELRAMAFEEVSKRGGKIVSEHAVGTKLVNDSQHYTPQEYADNLAVIKKHDPENIFNPDAFVLNYN